MLSDGLCSLFRLIKGVDQVLVVQDIMDVSLHTPDDVLLNFLKVFDLLIHLLNVFIVHLFQVFSLICNYFTQ